MKRYYKYIRPYLAYFIIGPIFMLTEVAGEIIMPKLMSNIINNGVITADSAYIVRTGIMMIITALIMMAGGVLGNFFATKSAVSMAADLRLDMFNKIQEFSFKNIDNLSTGSLVTRLTNDVTQIQNVVRMALVMMLRAPGMLLGALIMSLMINAKLALVILIVIPILAFSLYKIIITAYPRFDIMQKKLDSLNSRIQENLTNIRVVKSFVRTDYENKKFDKANRELKENTLKAFGIVILTMPVMTLAMNVTTIAVVWFGGNFVINGGMEIGELSAFTTYIVQILMSLMMLSMMLLMSSRALASAGRINEILDTEIDLKDSADADETLKVTDGKIEFRNVSFKYNTDSESNTLENISFVVNPGETVGILGATGSGKTTMVQLIPRLYDTTGGEVLVDGRNVKEYTLKNLRDGVGMVLQNNVLFSGTITENLQWGNEEASEEEIKGAAESAQADSFVSAFSEGYSTELEQGGTNVSGGQKQRLCIARALLKKPKILILDDSTSAVDTATEAKIRECFNSDLKNTTKLIIAQRITSVLSADKILVIDNGRIVGCGSHDTLISSNEEYREIYNSQMQKEG